MTTALVPRSDAVAHARKRPYCVEHPNFGAVGNGEDDDRAALFACDAMGPAEGIPGKTYKIADDGSHAFVFTHPFTFNGSTLAPVPGVTVTFPAWTANAADDVQGATGAFAKLGVGTDSPVFDLEVRGRSAVYTAVADDIHAFSIFHKADQANPDNQTISLAIHNYTDAKSLVVDGVGTGILTTLRQAHNSSERTDKAANYVGSGKFLSLQRDVTPTLGPSGGNLGDGNDEMAKFDENGNLVFYRDWDNTLTHAPLVIGTYTHFTNRALYMGYNDGTNESTIGSIDVGAGAYKPLNLMASVVKVMSALWIGGLAVSFGANDSAVAGYRHVMVPNV